MKTTKRQWTTKRRWTTGALALMLATGGAISARAQMNDDGPPPPPPPPGAPQGEKAGGVNRGARRTPEQIQAQSVQMLKRMLERAGFTDEKTQSAVADFAGERETATRALQEKMRAVNVALRNGAVTDQEIAASLANLRSAVAAEKTRRAGAEKALDAEIGWSKKPRLDALLTTMGLIGDEAVTIGGPGAMRGGGRGRGPGAGGAGGRNRRGGPDVPPPPRNDGPDDE